MSDPLRSMADLLASMSEDEQAQVLANLLPARQEQVSREIPALPDAPVRTVPVITADVEWD